MKRGKSVRRENESRKRQTQNTEKKGSKSVEWKIMKFMKQGVYCLKSLVKRPRVNANDVLRLRPGARENYIKC